MAANQRVTTTKRRKKHSKAGRKRKKLLGKRSTPTQEELFGEATPKT